MKKLGFGFMRLPLLDSSEPTSFDETQICQMVDTYLEQGFTYFDTAYMYHSGKSENMLKKALVERYPRESYLVADKLPTMFLKEPEDVTRIFQEQLDRTGLSYFDYYLLHCLDKENYQIAERLDCFAFGMQMKKEGKIRHLGFSFHDSAELLDTILTAHPEVEFVQLQINYYDWDSDNVQSGKCYEVARKHNKDIIIMEPIKGGKLANIPENAAALLRAQSPQLSIPSWAVRFTASLPGVIMVLSGMSNMEQLLDNTGYMKDFAPLTESEYQLCLEVGRLIRKENEIACTACHYCTDGCPAAIAIPELFELYNREGNREEYGKQTADGGKASDCLACGQCENHCPQHLPIIELLKKLTEKFEL
ncbi:MAG: aldo/keto reductase [Oscillospiraceae bacterium]|nr:aldo/keto reductase [Oscillospiraceae bacterium]